MLTEDKIIKNKYENFVLLSEPDSPYKTYKAKIKGTEQRVILKEIKSKQLEIYQKLMHESNAYVCEIKELISNGTNKNIVVQEYVNGIDIYEYIEENGTLAESEAIKITCQLCEGIRFIHKKGIVHKDLSYSNILIDRMGNAKIIDFGESKKIDKNKKYDTTLIISASFTAPECHSYNKVDYRADIYSLGAILRFILTGDVVPQEYTKNAKLEKVMNKCMSADPNNRFRNAHQLQRNLQKIVSKDKMRVMSNRRYFLKIFKTALITFCIVFVALSIFLGENLDEQNSNSFRETKIDGLAGAEMKMDAQNYEQAKKDLKQLLNEGIKSRSVYVSLAKCYLSCKDYEAAAQSLFDYINIIGRENILNYDNEAYVTLVALKNRVSDKTKREIKKLEKEVDVHIDIWTKAVNEYTKRNIDECIVSIDKLIDNNVKICSVYYLKAECFLLQGEKAKAKECIERFEQIYSDTPDYIKSDYERYTGSYREELFERCK